MGQEGKTDYGMGKVKDLPLVVVPIINIQNSQ